MDQARDRGFSPVEVTLARLALGAAVLFAIMLARREAMPALAAAVGAHHRGGAVRQRGAVPAVRGGRADRGLVHGRDHQRDHAAMDRAPGPGRPAPETVTSWQAAGLIVGFAGAVLIFSPWQHGVRAGLGRRPGMPGRIGQLRHQLRLHGPLPRPPGLSPVTLSACQLLAAAVMLAIALAITGAQTPHFTAESVAGVAVLGMIGTGIAYVLNYQIITSEGATVASTVTYLLPVVAIVLGVLVLGEASPRRDRGHSAGPGRSRAHPPSSESSHEALESHSPFRCDNFLYGFKGAPSARRAVPALADSAQDREVLREFVKRREVHRQELGRAAGLLGGSGAATARDLRAVALRSRAPPPRRCPASAGRRYRP